MKERKPVLVLIEKETFTESVLSDVWTFLIVAALVFLSRDARS